MDICFTLFLYTSCIKSCSSSTAYTILSYASNFLLISASTLLLEHLHLVVRWEVVIFLLSSLFLSHDMHGAGTRAVQTCWPIISFRDKFVDTTKLFKSTGAINVALWLNPFSFLHNCWWWINLQCWSHISQSSFVGFPCHCNNVHAIHKVPFSFIFCRNIPLTSCNKKCTTFFQAACFIQYMISWSSGCM